MRIHASLSRRMGPVITAARVFPKRLRKIFKGRSSSCALIEVQTDEVASTTPPTTPDGVVQLPQEIMDTIMECLGGNPEALRCYSIVCRSWHAATTRVLFRHLVIHTRNIEALDDIFYGSPHLVRHIRHLTFQLLPYTQRIEISRIRGVLHAVPGLQSVTLRLHSSNLSHSDSLGGEDTPSLTLRRLEITSELILMLYPANLTGLFSLFRSIDELSVCSEPHDDVVDILRNRLTGPPFNPPPPISPPLRVQRIAIREKCGDYGTVAILALLPCVADLGGITSLSLVAPIRFTRLCASVSSFVEVAENIETISIAFNRNRTADGLFHGLLPSALDLGEFDLLGREFSLTPTHLQWYQRLQRHLIFRPAKERASSASALICTITGTKTSPTRNGMLWLASFITPLQRFWRSLS